MGKPSGFLFLALAGMTFLSGSFYLAPNSDAGSEAPVTAILAPVVPSDSSHFWLMFVLTGAATGTGALLINTQKPRVARRLRRKARGADAPSRKAA